MTDLQSFFPTVTVFFAGCLNHVYICPAAPTFHAYRFIKRDWSDAQIKKHLDHFPDYYQYIFHLSEYFEFKLTVGSFRWSIPNFGGSKVYAGSRSEPVQYTEGASLGQMVTVWAQGNKSDIAGKCFAGILSIWLTCILL